MKVYIVGINFAQYTMLKKIEEYFINKLQYEVKYIEWLSKSNINTSSFEDGDIYIWVEVQPLFPCNNSMYVEKDEDKKDTLNKFSVLLKCIEKKNKSNNEEDIKSDPVVTDTEQRHEYKAVISDNKKSSLSGINVEIDGKEYYISKEDYDELYKLDEMLSKHGYKISSIVLED